MTHIIHLSEEIIQLRQRWLADLMSMIIDDLPLLTGIDAARPAGRMNHDSAIGQRGRPHSHSSSWVILSVSTTGVASSDAITGWNPIMR